MNISMRMQTILRLTCALLLAGVFLAGCEARVDRGVSPKNACLFQLRGIDFEKRQWAIDNNKTTNDIPTDADIFGTNSYWKVKPVCPEAGTYTLGRVGSKPRCSMHGAP
jgi:hypothetical protein